MTISMVVATDRAGAIGRGNDLPWHIPSDLKRFRELTTGHVLVVGSRTHASIVARLGKSLPGRTCVVATHQPDRPPLEGVEWAGSVGAALDRAECLAQENGDDEVFVIGGAAVYSQCLGRTDRIYQTVVETRVAGADAFMPLDWLGSFRLVRIESCKQYDERDQFPTGVRYWERISYRARTWQDE
ncbi:MAG TPA: dihydrofolate reductase [Candidatus Saccharimonas sp.]|nr:dihydrofolate reductase [Candidatus Saccharimonas sp.]